MGYVSMVDGHIDNMTPQEALHEISTMVYRNTDDFEMRISKDCYKSIVSALQKDIPQKVNRHTSYKGGRIKNLGSCAVCGCAVQPNESYCVRCGQALDWSDTE